MFQWLFYMDFCLIAQLVRPILLEVFGHFQICATGPPRPRTFLGRSALAPPVMAYPAGAPFLLCEKKGGKESTPGVLPLDPLFASATQ